MRNRILFLVCLFGTVTLFTTNLYAQNDYKELSTWTGTGFALNKGHIVTNYHVVEDANSISVSGINGDFTKTYQATVVATDKVNDLAILKINDNRFTGFGALPYSIRWQMAEVGDDVFVLGYPLTQTMGEEIKLTNGIISSRTGFQGDASLYQMSAPIQPGNSGGPMFDSKGNVIGIVCAQHRGTENVGYAIKTSYLKNLAESFSLTNIFPTNNTVSTLTLSGQVKKLKNYVYIIQCSNSGSGILSSNIVADPNMITIRVGNVSFDMIKVKSGSFIMGCTSEQGEDCFETEKPCHRVTITKDYYIGKFEVTQELYKVVMNTNPSEYKTNEHPVENVS